MSEPDTMRIQADIQEVIKEINEAILKFEIMAKDVTYILNRLHSMASVYYKLLDEIRFK